MRERFEVELLKSYVNFEVVSVEKSNIDQSELSQRVESVNQLNV